MWELKKPKPVKLITKEPIVPAQPLHQKPQFFNPKYPKLTGQEPLWMQAQDK
jgi:hypothetical protein